jgi:hypothetical protein
VKETTERPLRRLHGGCTEGHGGGVFDPIGVKIARQARNFVMAGPRVWPEASPRTGSVQPSTPFSPPAPQGLDGGSSKLCENSPTLMVGRKFFFRPGNPISCQIVMARLDRAISGSGGSAAPGTMPRWPGMARSSRAMTCTQAALVVPIEESSAFQRRCRVFARPASATMTKRDRFAPSATPAYAPPKSSKRSFRRPRPTAFPTPAPQRLRGPPCLLRGGRAAAGSVVSFRPPPAP